MSGGCDAPEKSEADILDARCRALEAEVAIWRAECGAKVTECDRLTRERDEAVADARRARAGEAYRKAETDRSWQVLRDRGAIDTGGGDLDRRVTTLIDALERAEGERDEAQEALKLAVERHDTEASRLEEELSEARASGADWASRFAQAAKAEQDARAEMARLASEHKEMLGIAERATIQRDDAEERLRRAHDEIKRLKSEHAAGIERLAAKVERMHLVVKAAKALDVELYAGRASFPFATANRLTDAIRTLEAPW